MPIKSVRFSNGPNGNSNPSPPTSSIGTPTPRAPRQRSSTPVPIQVAVHALSRETFRDLLFQIREVPASPNPFIQAAQDSIRNDIHAYHSGALAARKLDLEPQIMAAWRPIFWTRQFELLQNAPKLTDPRDVEAMTKFKEVVGGLMGTSKVPSPGANRKADSVDRANNTNSR